MKGIVAPRRWAVNDAQLDAAGTRRMKRASTVLLTLRHRRQLTGMRSHRPTRRLHTPAETKIKAVLSMLQVAVLMASSSPSAYRGSSATPTSPASDAAKSDRPPSGSRASRVPSRILYSVCDPPAAPNRDLHIGGSSCSNVDDATV